MRDGQALAKTHLMVNDVKAAIDVLAEALEYVIEHINPCTRISTDIYRVVDMTCSRHSPDSTEILTTLGLLYLRSQDDKAAFTHLGRSKQDLLQRALYLTPSAYIRLLFVSSHRQCIDPQPAAAQDHPGGWLHHAGSWGRGLCAGQIPHFRCAHAEFCPGTPSFMIT